MIQVTFMTLLLTQFAILATSTPIDGRDVFAGRLSLNFRNHNSQHQNFEATKFLFRQDAGEQPGVRKGVTFDHCNVTTDCEPPRHCTTGEAGEGYPDCPPGEEICICTPPGDSNTTFERCEHKFDCTELREQCVISKSDGLICVSSAVANHYQSNFIFNPTSVDQDATPRPTNEAYLATWYPCRKDESCKGDRYCAQVVNSYTGLPPYPWHMGVPPTKENFQPCNQTDLDSCYCFGDFEKTLADCTETGCEQGEVCAYDTFMQNTNCLSADAEAAYLGYQAVSLSPSVSPTTSSHVSVFLSPSPSNVGTVVGASPDFSTSFASVSPTTSTASTALESTPTQSPMPNNTPPIESISPSATPSALLVEQSPSPEAVDAVCIDAEALGHLRREELVFSEHKWANVWCDVNGSCATAGHMVTFMGKAMMMSKYCAIVKCTRSEMYVNSPRYRRGMRVKSMTEGLSFTALAARYATTVEEVALQMAVRLGY